MSIEDWLDTIEDMIDNARSIPMVNGRVINPDDLRDAIQNIRIGLPQEIRKAQSIVQKRNDILTEARKNADEIVHQAELRAHEMVAQEEIVRRATAMAAEKEARATAKAKEIRAAARDFADGCLSRTETYLTQRLQELRRARQSLNQNASRNPVDDDDSND